MDQRAFVKAVLDHTGLTKTQLGVELRLSTPYPTVNGWTTGHATLKYPETMAMLRMCGWLAIGDTGLSQADDDAQLARLEQHLATTLALIQELLAAHEPDAPVEVHDGESPRSREAHGSARPPNP